VLGISGKDDQIGTRLAAAEPQGEFDGDVLRQGEFDGDVLLRVAVFAHQGLGDLLPDVFLWGFLALSLAVDEIQHFALLDDDGGGL